MVSLAEELSKRSSLTNSQLDTIVIRKGVMNHDIVPREAPKRRHGGEVSPGAYYRVLEQARNNIYRSIFTVLTAGKLGVLKLEEFKRLAEIISQSSDVEDETVRQALQVVDALIEKIVTI